MIITGCYFVTKKWHSLHLNCRRQVEYIYLNQVLVKLTALLKRLSNGDITYVKEAVMMIILCNSQWVYDLMKFIFGNG